MVLLNKNSSNASIGNNYFKLIGMVWVNIWINVVYLQTWKLRCETIVAMAGEQGGGPAKRVDFVGGMKIEKRLLARI